MTEAAKSKSDEIRQSKVDGRTIAEWEADWQHIPNWTRTKIPDGRHNAAVLRFRRGADIVYIGRASEVRAGGIRKRLRDFTRWSPSARTHFAGEMIHRHQAELEVDILVTGMKHRAADTNLKLKRAFVRLYEPMWQVSKQM